MIGIFVDNTQLRLFNYWQKLLQPLDIDNQSIEDSFQKIVSAYSSSGRYYHNLEHIHHVLINTTKLQHLVQEGLSLSLSAWLHDVIYDSQSQNNELYSAEFASELLEKMHINYNIINRVCNLILTTKFHHPDSNDIDAQILIDADLAILGTRSDIYQDYALAIRKEYIWVKENAYIQGRIKILENFLARPQIYFTADMRHQLEGFARQNMQEEIKLLRNQGNVKFI
ncbi:hypothetical protein IJ00_04320 [Calothrix sp. 336/3]|nr:hypothetical protein IJ00_04320 [Calothrix sp. 336/3]